MRTFRFGAASIIIGTSTEAPEVKRIAEPLSVPPLHPAFLKGLAA